MSTKHNDETVDSSNSVEITSIKAYKSIEDLADYVDRHCMVTGRELYPLGIYDDPSSRQVTLSIIEFTDLIWACELLGVTPDSLASTWVHEGVDRLFDRCAAALAGTPLPDQYPRLPDMDAVAKYVKEYDLPPLPRKWKRRIDLER